MPAEMRGSDDRRSRCGWQNADGSGVEQWLDTGRERSGGRPLREVGGTRGGCARGAGSGRGGGRHLARWGYGRRERQCSALRARVQRTRSSATAARRAAQLVLRGRTAGRDVLDGGAAGRRRAKKHWRRSPTTPTIDG
eukprot:ctg_669.g159